VLSLFLAKWNALLAVTQQHQKGTKFHELRSLLVHSVELSTLCRVVKVDINVFNASSTRNQCLQCVPLALTHAEIPWRRDTTELNNDALIKLGDIQYQTKPNSSIFSKRDLINDSSSFCSQILLAIELQCHVFLLESFC